MISYRILSFPFLHCSCCFLSWVYCLCARNSKKTRGAELLGIRRPLTRPNPGSHPPMGWCPHPLVCAQCPGLAEDGQKAAEDWMEFWHWLLWGEVLTFNDSVGRCGTALASSWLLWDADLKAEECCTSLLVAKQRKTTLSLLCWNIPAGLGRDFQPYLLPTCHVQNTVGHGCCWATSSQPMTLW